MNIEIPTTVSFEVRRHINEKIHYINVCFKHAIKAALNSEDVKVTLDDNDYFECYDCDEERKS